jgi:hypothetical protein
MPEITRGNAPPKEPGWTGQVLNAVQETLKLFSPLVNRKVGQVDPGTKYQLQGLIFWADGTNWDPLGLGRPYHCIWNGTDYQLFSTSNIGYTPQVAIAEGAAFPANPAPYQQFVINDGGAQTLYIYNPNNSEWIKQGDITG